MAAAAAVGADAIRDGFAELERQQELLATCRRLYQQHTDHFGSLDRGIKSRSDSLRCRRRLVELRASRRLELALDGSVALALSRLESLTNKRGRDSDGSLSPRSDSAGGVAEGLAALS